MKLKTIKLFIAVLCVLLLGVGNATAGTLRVAQDGLEEFKTYDSDVTDICLPNQLTIDGKSTGTLSYNSNAHKLTFNNVHRTSSLQIKNTDREFFYYGYATPLTIELVGDNELTVEQAFSASARLFSGNIKIVGDGSLKLNLKSSRSGNTFSLRVVDGGVDMQGTGVVEMTLSNYNINDYDYTYAATGVKLQEGMMLSNSSSAITTTKETELIQYVYRENGGLNFGRSGKNAFWLRIEPLKKYNLFVAGKQVNWINMTDILGDGHVSYQPYSSTPGSTPSGLITLNNADIHYEYDGTNMPRIFEHSSVSDAANHVAGVHPNGLDIKLVGKNKITGVVNSQLDSKTPFFGFPRMARFSGSGTLRMELSANKAAEGGVYGFGTLTITDNTVVLQDSFTGWVSVSTSNVGTNPASVFMNNARYLVLPDNSTYTDYFIASGNTLPVVARTNVAEQNKDLNVAHVNFGKKDGSAAPTGTITRPLFQTAYVGKTLADKTLGLEVTGGQAPFYYSATGLQDGLSINPENGYVSGTYTTANTPASDAQTTLTVTDVQGRQASVSVAKQEVVPKLAFVDSSDSDILTLKPKWAQGIAIDQVYLREKFSGGKAPYTYYTIAANSTSGYTTLPTGVSLDKSKGVISGTPTERKEYKYGITVEDALGQIIYFNVQGNVAENYGFSVAGVPVTGYNKDNILIADHHLDYDLIQGNISYDPTSKKLILDRLKVEFEVYDNDIAEDFFIILNDQNAFDGQPINVHVKGACSIMVDNKYDGEAQFIFPRSIIVTGENSGNETPKLTLGGIRGGCVLDAVDGDVVVNGNVMLDFSTFGITINGYLTIPEDQIVYINGSANPLNGGTHGNGTYTYDLFEAINVVTAPHPNGALCFTNEKEGKTIYNTVPVKPFAMFDVMGGVAPYRYSATSLPSGLTIDATTGYISGTSEYSNSNATVTFTVTDAMGREVSADMGVAVKNPTLKVKECGGTTERTSTVSKWGNVIAGTKLLQAGQLLLVDADFNAEETILEIPNNVVVSDVNGNTYAKNITLTDGVKYAFPYEVEAQSISYTRTFPDVIVNKWQCLYVPFDITITDELLKDFDFSKLYMISYKDANNNGEIEDGEPLVMLLMKQTEGKVLHANTPYFIKAKTAGTKSIQVESATLKPVENGTVYCCTTEHEYTLTGIYNTFNINGNYTMGVSGGFSYYDIDTNLKPNRWYMQVNSLTGKDDEDAAKARQIILMVDGEDDTTGIMDITSGSKTSTAEGVFTLDGRKINETENLSRGIYIKNGKKIMVK